MKRKLVVIGAGMASGRMLEQLFDAAPDGAVVVGHSAAGSLAWMAADRRPDAVRAVVGQVQAAAL